MCKYFPVLCNCVSSLLSSTPTVENYQVGKEEDKNGLKVTINELVWDGWGRYYRWIKSFLVGVPFVVIEGFADSVFLRGNYSGFYLKVEKIYR